MKRVSCITVLVGSTLGLIAIGWQQTPSVRLFLMTVCLLFVVKICILLVSTGKTESKTGLFFFTLLWPGMDMTPFSKKPLPAIEDAKRFSGGVTRCLVCLGLFLVLCWNLDHVSHGLASWLGIFLILGAVHLGFTDAWTEFVRAIGWPVKPLFDAPWRSVSLSDFWTQRWNRPFVEMNRILFMPMLSRLLGIKGAVFATFIVSGLFHELAISYPAKAGYGFPLMYFAIQGVGILVERKAKIKGLLWTIVVILAPVSLLFNGWFRQELISPFLQWTHHTLHSIGLKGILSGLLWIAGAAQFMVLLASVQVPTRLRWKEELPRLSSLNHKLMWTYGSFIVLTIVGWGVLTLVLHDEILQGTRAGLAISVMIFSFWGLRLVTDRFYFKSSDWPSGPFLQIGHTLLNCLFTFIFLTYGSVIVWNLLS